MSGAGSRRLLRHPYGVRGTVRFGGRAATLPAPLTITKWGVYVWTHAGP